jgi:heme/copper-type cytochrome/quinol oxidase subunit 2
MHGDTDKPETIKQDPETLLRLLDLELKQKRVSWQQAAARHRTSRMISLFSIFVVIVAGLFALFFLFSRANQERANSRPPAISDTPGR